MARRSGRQPGGRQRPHFALPERFASAFLPALLIFAPTVQGLYGEDSVGAFPYFEYNVERNVTTVMGDTAFLHCRVEQLGDKAVSWMRRRDLHILTAGILTYTSDQRFSVIRADKSENWTLQIKFCQARDAGVYECQVNTEPKMSLPFYLNVVEAAAQILGPADVYVRTGSALSLTCVLAQGPHHLNTVSWYRDSELLGVSGVEEAEAEERNEVGGQRVHVHTYWSSRLTSRLRIERARLSDSGNYSCQPTLARPAYVSVHVINGEQPAAMQHGQGARAHAALTLPALMAFCASRALPAQFR